MGSFNIRRFLSAIEENENTTVGDIHDKKQAFLSSFWISLIVILCGCFLIVCCSAMIVKICSKLKYSRRRRRHIQPQNEIQEHSDLDDAHEDFLDENHGPVVEHHIWYINTVGLAQSVIDSIAVFKYKKGEEGLIDGDDCAICLSEFEEDETLRLLPKCSHAFHVSCIDTWLRSHTNCPCCRAPIVKSAVVSETIVSVPNSSSPDGGGERGVDGLATNGGLVTDSNGEDELTDSSVGVQDESEEHDRIRDIVIPKNRVLPPAEMCGIRVLSDLSDNHRILHNGRQRGKRSASMDFNPASIFCFSVANSLPVEEDEESSIVPLESREKGNLSPGQQRLMGSSSKGISVSMKRSFSSGGKLVSSRSSRNQMSILPL